MALAYAPRADGTGTGKYAYALAAHLWQAAITLATQRIQKLRDPNSLPISRSFL